MRYETRLDRSYQDQSRLSLSRLLSPTKIEAQTRPTRPESYCPSSRAMGLPFRGSEGTDEDTREQCPTPHANDHTDPMAAAR